MAHDISVVGLYIVDVLGRPITEIPTGGGVEFIEEIRFTVAGTAGGTAVDCAKLGMKTWAIGAVGSDEKAEFLLNTLSRYGVDVSHMQRIQDAQTSSTILCIQPSGERPALHARGASDQFVWDREGMTGIFDAPFVHMGGTGLLRAMDGPPTVELLRQAKEKGCITSFDLVGARPETMMLVEPALPFVDYFMPSIEEAAIMSGRTQTEDIAKYFLDLGVRTCVLTMGAQGAVIVSPRELIRIPAFEVTVVDTTGCGDAFSAGFLAALKAGFDVEKAGRFASAAGALVATGLGSDAGIIDFDHTAEAMMTLPIKG